MTRERDERPDPRAGTFIMCRDRRCEKWAPHGHIMIGTHEPFMMRNLFSQEAALAAVRKAVKEEYLLADSAGELDRAIRRARLPPELQRGDFVTRYDSSNETFLDLIFGVTREDGSGPDRFILCQGQCGFNRCADFPPHGAVYMQGKKDPLTFPAFSRQTANERLTWTVENGLVGNEVRSLIEVQIAESGIDQLETTRADRLVRLGERGTPFLEMGFGLRRPEPGSGEARFEVVPATEREPIHGRFYAAGFRTFSASVYSLMRAGEVLKQTHHDGVLYGDEVPRVMAQIAASGLPLSHERDEAPQWVAIRLG